MIGSDTWNPTKGRKLWHFYSLYESYGLGLGLELGLGLVLGSGLGLGLGLGVAPNAGLHCFLPEGESCGTECWTPLLSPEGRKLWHSLFIWGLGLGWVLGLGFG